MKKITSAAVDGFLGSFKLAAAILIAIGMVASAFASGGPDAAMQAAKHAK
jgi:hypothetical protein